MKKFTVTHRESSGNLHIAITGEFNGQCAWELIRIVETYYKQPGKIFVQTRDITFIEEQALVLYKNLYNSRRIPPHNFYFKGETGFKIALNGQRVLLATKNCQSPSKRGLTALPRFAPKIQTRR